MRLTAQTLRCHGVTKQMTYFPVSELSIAMIPLA